MANNLEVTMHATRSEGDHGIYRGEVVDLVKAIRTAGLRADYEHDAEHRLWLELFGEAEIGFVMSIAASSVGAAAWEALRGAFKAWFRMLPPKQELKIQIRFRKSKSGQNLELLAEGKGADVLATLDRIPQLLENDSSSREE
jgi:hypothetical protein